MIEAVIKLCRRCDRRPAIETELYCSQCKRSLWWEMLDSGYLQELPEKTLSAQSGRPKWEECEEGAWENGMRSLEEKARVNHGWKWIA